MGIKVVIDEDLAGRLPTQPIGVLVGLKTPLYVLSYHATPPAPYGVSASRWLASHVDQVNGMCVGGVCVVGIYTPNSATEVETEVNGMRTARLNLLLYKGGRGRLMGKEVKEDVTRSMELKSVGRLLDNIVVLTVRVEMDIAVEKGNLEEDLITALNNGILMFSGGFVVVNTNDERELSSVMGWTEKEEDKTVSGEILLPLGSGGVQSKVCVKGGMHVEAVVTSESTVGEVLNVLRDDLRRSVQTRLQLLHEMEADDEIATRQSSQGKAIPVRVLARAQGRLPMTEYLAEGESLDQDVQSRFVEVLSWTDEDIEQYELVQTEHFADVSKFSSDSRSKKPDVESLDIEKIEADTNMDSHISFAIGLAVLIAFLAILYKNLFT